MKTKKEELQSELTRLNALKKQVKEKLKALPVLEVGKWYWISNKNVHYEDTDKTMVNALIFNNGEERSYGFNSIGVWTSFFYLIGNLDDIITEATPQEVEQALIEEAKSRGHAYSQYDYNTVENELCGINNWRLESVFCDGHWEQTIDKFEELKKAHRKGAKIEIWSGLLNKWFVVENEHVLWLPDYEYRIKPEEKPKVGDVCKFWNEDEDAFVVSFFMGMDDKYYRSLENGYDNAKTLTQQEAIDLLFNKGAN